MQTAIIVLAHNEERRIAACLASLPLDDAGVGVTVVVNGSSDRTAAIVRDHAERGVRLVEYEQGGKARSWNRFVLGEAPEADMYVFVDGDAVLAPGSVVALGQCLTRNPEANAAAALPLNGRSKAFYQRSMRAEQGLFGDCYALSGAFVRSLRDSGVRLPDDLIGDDSLINALANTGRPVPGCGLLLRAQSDHAQRFAAAGRAHGELRLAPFPEPDPQRHHAERRRAHDPDAAGKRLQSLPRSPAPAAQPDVVWIRSPGSGTDKGRRLISARLSSTSARQPNHITAA